MNSTTSVRVKWAIAIAAALVVGFAVARAPLPWPSFSNERAQAAATKPTAAAGAVCDPKVAKDANLDFTLKDMNGKDVRLSDFKGKVILLDFWATWCGPCKTEIPGFVELHDKYAKDGLVVIGVSVDDTPDKLKPFVSEFKMNYTVLQGLNRDDFVEDAYGPMFGIPTTFIIGRDGRICAKHVGMASKESFEQAIKSLL